MITEHFTLDWSKISTSPNLKIHNYWQSDFSADDIYRRAWITIILATIQVHPGTMEKTRGCIACTLSLYMVYITPRRENMDKFQDISTSPNLRFDLEQVHLPHPDSTNSTIFKRSPDILFTITTCLQKSPFLTFLKLASSCLIHRWSEEPSNISKNTRILRQSITASAAPTSPFYSPARSNEIAPNHSIQS